MQKCGRVRHSSTVELRMADGRASYGGLVTCGAVWLCPPCQAKIAAYRSLEVAAVTEWAEANGVAMFFGALTVHHGPNDPLPMSLGTLNRSWRRLIQGAGWQQIVDAAGGQIQFIRSLEINIGANGWHPHLHPLVLMPRAAGRGAAEHAVQDMLGRWVQIVVAEGGRVSVDAQQLAWVENAPDVGAYITDQTYQGKASRVDLEMTTSQSKSGFGRAKGTKSHWSIIENLANSNADNAHYVSSP
ncbi:protein rep [Lysobacter korlensis]|uniref:Protein rep n=1 Tax=Lysobacter korlensis TaxID=553636 RepID=A0ABV6RWW9_9GAMM